LIQRVHQADGCHTVMRKQNGHEHLLVCTSCGRTVTFCGDNFESLSSKVASETGFAVSDHMLQFLVFALNARVRKTVQIDPFPACTACAFHSCSFDRILYKYTCLRF